MHSSSLIDSLVHAPVDLSGPQGSRLETRLRIAQSSSASRKNSELKKSADQFEAVFIAQLLKIMRQTIEESGLAEGGFGKSIYTELFDQELALNMSRRGTLGISDLLYRNLVEREEPASPDHAAPVVHDNHLPQADAKSEAAELEISGFQLPVHARVSSGFGLRKDPFSGSARFHKGLDLAAPEGMRVVPALPGNVISAGYVNGYGNTVVVEHHDGLQTRYGHLKEINVRAGETVTPEDTIGTVGSTGRSTGPHLHFEVIRMGNPVDPLTVLNPRISSRKTSPGA